MALACGQKPDHSTIAAFISSMGEEIGRLFTRVLLVCDEEGLLGGTHFSLDGLKLSSNAAKEWSGTFEDLEEKKENLDLAFDLLSQVGARVIGGESLPEIGDIPYCMTAELMDGIDAISAAMLGDDSYKEDDGSEDAGE